MRSTSWNLLLVLSSSLIPASSAGAGVSGPFPKGEPVLITRAENGMAGNGSSMRPKLSENGRWLTFSSYAYNLIPGDSYHSNNSQVELLDTRTGELRRLSLSPDGEVGNGKSFWPVISRNGRWIVYKSNATNLIPDDPNPPTSWELFLYDRKKDRTTRITRGVGGAPLDDEVYEYSISDDGRYVAFISRASNIVPGDENGVQDVFLHDRKRGRTRRLSRRGDGSEFSFDSRDPVVAGHGKFVLFTTREQAHGADANGLDDIYLYDIRKQRLRLPVRARNGKAPSGGSRQPALSGTGRRLVFSSASTDLLRGYDTVVTRLYLLDLKTGKLRLGHPGIAGNNLIDPQVSNDGKTISFRGSDVFDPTDDNGFTDCFLLDRRSQAITRITAAPENGAADGYSYDPVMTGNGKFIVFTSRATNLVDGVTTDLYTNVYVYRW